MARKVLRLRRGSYLLILSALAPLGAFLHPTLPWILAYSLVPLWILARKAQKGGLALLWGVASEPAPADLLWVWGLVRRALARLTWPPLLVFHLLVLFALLNLVQLLWVEDLRRGIFFAGVTVYLVGVFLLFAKGIPDREAWEAIKKHYLVGVWTATTTLLALGLLALLGQSHLLPELYYGNGERPRGFFKDPNVAGPFAATGALLSLSYLLFVPKGRLAQGGLLALASLATALTFSRGALLNLAVGGMVLLGLASFLRKGTRTLGIALGIAVLIGLLPPILFEIFGQGSRFRLLTSYDLEGRLMAWEAGLRLLTQNPWGVGPGQFEEGIAAYFQAYSSHNMYLRILVENGALGFLMIGLAVLVTLRMGFRTLQRTIQTQDLRMTADTAWALAALAGTLVEGMVIDTLHWRHFWVIWGMLMAAYLLANQKRE